MRFRLSVSPLLSRRRTKLQPPLPGYVLHLLGCPFGCLFEGPFHSPRFVHRVLDPINSLPNRSLNRSSLARWLRAGLFGWSLPLTGRKEAQEQHEHKPCACTLFHHRFLQAA